MKLSDHITAFAPPELTWDAEPQGRVRCYDHRLKLEQENVERVRSYLIQNLGCMQVEVCRALDLDKRTVSKAIKIIRGKL